MADKDNAVNNLALWDRVRTPDPKYTKKFDQGGFKGTSTNVTYTVRELTREFGECGTGWGYDIMDSDYVPTGTGEILHVCTIKFWYVRDNKTHSFPQIGQTDFVKTVKRGTESEYQKVDSEAPKKSLSDAITKAASFLGFSADIHLGLWDDNKYVQEVQDSYHSKEVAGKYVAKVIETLKANDPIAMALLEASIGQDDWRAMFNGTSQLSSKQKNEVRESCQRGNVMLNEYADALTEAASTNAQLSGTELWDELSKDAKRIVWNRIGEEAREFVRELKDIEP